MAERKTTKKVAEAVAEPKKTTARKTAKKAVAIDFSDKNIGFKAGDVYQALAAAEGNALSVEEIAKTANISVEEALLGLGWLYREVKVNGTEEGKIVLL